MDTPPSLTTTTTTRQNQMADLRAQLDAANARIAQLEASAATAAASTAAAAAAAADTQTQAQQQQVVVAAATAAAQVQVDSLGAMLRASQERLAALEQAVVERERRADGDKYVLLVAGGGCGWLVVVVLSIQTTPDTPTPTHTPLVTHDTHTQSINHIIYTHD